MENVIKDNLQLFKRPKRSIIIIKILDEETDNDVGMHKFPAKLFKPYSYEARTGIWKHLFFASNGVGQSQTSFYFDETKNID